ncbi:type II CAAX endopeptidase family protein [Oscillatoria sp. CS-180]|uniref:CPBP family intramembrane glutamic endopeptidase n=1 Tax=Oscillatoria sp. CS-180 TaxID=3021720 RepID=UPI002331396D|nr:type II CAAX endopeptidase family protein [Oscillatoria sp. CS-180]MDB9527550.1 type II CAAX endopeptidase family protein [Oscillatoria sp. CS-180]
MKKFVRFVRYSPALVKAVIVVLIVVLIASPLAIPLYRFEYAATDGKSVIWTPILLFLVFIAVLPSWMRWIHQCFTPWRVVGMQAKRIWLKGWLVSFIIGALGVLILYGLQMALGWGVWVSPVASNLLPNCVEGLLVGMGVGLVEELIFRGWLLFEIEKDFSTEAALVINAGIFAIAHYIRPLSVILATWPQFVGLFLLGMALVWARRIPTKHNQQFSPVTTLGPAAGLHGGLVFAYYQFDVNDLVVSTHRVPAWLTGIDDNPLAGLLGLALLTAIAYAAYVASHPVTGPKNLQKRP